MDLWPQIPSAALAEIVGSKPLPRTKVIKKVWAYIQKNGLQDSKQKSFVNADDKLKAVFGGKAKVDLYEMTNLVNQHVRPMFGLFKKKTIKADDPLRPESESKLVYIEEFAKYLDEATPSLVIERSDNEAWVVHLRDAPDTTEVFRLESLQRYLGSNPERMPAKERRRIYERIVAVLVEELRFDVEPPDANRIFPRLVPSSFLDLDPGDILISVPYPGPGSFALVFVEDQAESVRYLNRKSHPKLPPDEELKEAAFKNLERAFKAKLEQALDASVRTKKLGAIWTDEYDGLRALLLLPGLLRKGEEVFVSQPQRDTLLILPPPADGNLDRYKDGAMADVEFSPGMITGLYRVTDSGFSCCS